MNWIGNCFFFIKEYKKMSIDMKYLEFFTDFQPIQIWIWLSNNFKICKLYIHSFKILKLLVPTFVKNRNKVWIHTQNMDPYLEMFPCTNFRVALCFILLINSSFWIGWPILLICWYILLIDCSILLIDSSIIWLTTHPWISASFSWLVVFTSLTAILFWLNAPLSWLTVSCLATSSSWLSATSWLTATAFWLTSTYICFYATSYL